MSRSLYSPPGIRLQQAVKQAGSEGKPLQIVGTINAYTARMAQKIGHQAVYLSGGGLAANSLGLPDLGISALEDVLIDTRRITASCDLPLLVDADTGFGAAFNIQRTVKELIRAGAAGLHIEDQVAQKRCGHRPNKAIVPLDEMLDRVKAAVDARGDSGFVIMARTDAIAVEGMTSALDRMEACIEAGADMIFPEAVQTMEQYQAIKQRIAQPILANITEFGHTPLFSTQDLAAVGVDIVLYCCGAYRAMNQAAESVYQSLLNHGHQRDELANMQTREQLYEYLDYHRYEQQLDQLFSQEK